MTQLLLGSSSSSSSDVSSLGYKAVFHGDNLAGQQRPMTILSDSQNRAQEDAMMHM